MKGIKVLTQNTALLQDKEPYNYIQSIRRDQIIIGIYLFGHIAASLAVVSVPLTFQHERTNLQMP